MYKRALVTGGAGFIGSHLSRALLKENLDVIVLDNLSMGNIQNVPDKAEFIQGDVRSAEDVTGVLAGVDVVFHEAARVSIRSSIEAFFEDAEINIMGTLNLLRCCAGSQVKKIIFASSMAVYADSVPQELIDEEYEKEPISPYGNSKLACEKYCYQFSYATGIHCHVLRYFNTYGVGQTPTPYVGVVTIFINRLIDGKPPMIFGDGEQRRDFIHVSDIVSANILSMNSRIPRQIFNVGTGIGTSVNEIAKMLCKKINPDLQCVYKEEHPGELRNSISDISRIRKALGYHPKGLLTEKIDEVIEYYKTKDGSGSGILT